MKKAVERRVEIRRTINHEFVSVDAFIDEYVMNISRSGVFVRSDDPLPVGTKVNLRFTVIMDDLETIEGIGQVVRVIRGRTQETGMGVVFIQLSQVSKEIIERILVRR